MPVGSLINAFARYRVAANVLMLVFFITGGYALAKLTVRFFPPFETNTITVTVIWQGATPADIEDSVVVPLENELRAVPDFDKIYSYSRENNGVVVLEFPDRVDLNKALEDIKTEVDRANLPDDAEAPLVLIAEFPEQIMKITMAGDNDAELRELGRRFERELGALNAGKVDVAGIQEEEISVLVDQRRLVELGLSLQQIGQAVGAQNVNASAGSLEGLGSERRLRADAKTSDLALLGELPVAADRDGNLIRLKEVASITREPADDQVRVLFNGRPAVEFWLTNNAGQHILDAAAKFTDWVEQTSATLPPSIDLVAHEQDWRYVRERLDLLIRNGATGLVLVLIVLFLFLSGRVAFWVAAGIPVAMLGTLFTFYLLGGTINMLSLFALIMAIGIIVDDAIVVGENAQHRLNQGEPPMRAVIGAAKTMFVPVAASSLTTIAAFLPLFLVTGPIGSIIFDIPLIIVCILIAAVIECFLILPGHLYHTFAARAREAPSRFRSAFDAGFHNFRQRVFRPLAAAAVNNALATIVACIMMMALAIGLLANGFVGYRFFPGAEGNKVFTSVAFTSGTPRHAVVGFVDDLNRTLHATASEFPGEGIVEHVTILYGSGGEFSPNSDERARIVVELIDPGKRDFTVDEFSAAWRSKIIEPPGIETFDIRGETSGPPGRDIEVRLTAPDVSQIKEVSQLVQGALNTIPGVSSVNDDTPYGKEQIIFELTPLARSLNLKVSDLIEQLLHATDGYLVQTFTEGVDEVELRVKLTDFNEDQIGAFLFRLPSGEYIPFVDLVTRRSTVGFETIVHQYGSPAVVVAGDLEQNAPITVGQVLQRLEQGILSDLAESRGVGYTFEGKNKDEQQTAQDMMTGLALAVILIYIILTWVFNSWTMPFVVMLTMPLGVIGSIFGHWLMGLQMSILSFFGIFTLMGIIVNDSIVLVKCFMDLREETDDAEQYNSLIVDAACLRLRAVLLTSLTTIGGLMPLVFETSLQAQFLKPMAVSISFGLAFATVLILLFTPACMGIHGSLLRFLRRRAAHARRAQLVRQGAL